MTFVVPSIVEVLMNKVAFWISIRANDCIAERAIIASNDKRKRKNMTFSRLMDMQNDLLLPFNYLKFHITYFSPQIYVLKIVIAYLLCNLQFPSFKIILRAETQQCQNKIPVKMPDWCFETEHLHSALLLYIIQPLLLVVHSFKLQNKLTVLQFKKKINSKRMKTLLKSYVYFCHRNQV